MTCEGFGAWSIGAGFIEARADGVVIEKKIAANGGLSQGMMNALLSAATSSAHGHAIPYESIMSVNVSKGGWGSRPFIQVVSTGESLISDPEKAQESPSCFLVRKDALQNIIDLKDEIERRVAAAKASARAPGGVASEIAKLGDLLNQGLIDRSQFEAAKRKLLGI